MKRILTLLSLILILLLPMTTSFASFDEVKDDAISNLTEVYGYTAEEADDFIFEDIQTDEEWRVSYWHKDHPEWVYTLYVNKTSPDRKTGTSPFGSTIGSTFGESSVRDALREAEQNAWFSCWTKANQAAFLQYMSVQYIDIMPNAALSTGITNGSIIAEKAIYEFFTSCYGDEITWTEATKQWYEFVLTSNNLSANQADITTSVARPIKGVRTYLSRMDNQANISYTDFYQEIPAELTAVLRQPQFNGWTCLTGALRTAGSPSENPQFNGYGLVILEKEGKRQLVMLFSEPGSGVWQPYYLGEKMLYTEREVFIGFTRGERLLQQFTIQYPLSDTKTEVFEVVPYIHPAKDPPIAYLQLESYSSSDRETGEGVIITRSNATDDTGAKYISVTTKVADEPAKEETIKGNLPKYFDYADMATFPTNAEECMAFGKMLGNVLPDGYGICSNVHLRAKTSTRSEDLGLYNYGTLVKVLEVLPGNPDSWAKVEIGSVTGYMSGAYVSYPGTENYLKLDDQIPLPAASANKDTALKKGTNLLSGKVTDIPIGTKMHVLGTRGKWLHVSIPSEGYQSDTMDTQGTDGFIWAEDVSMTSSMHQLLWTK